MRVQITSGRGPRECELAVGLYGEFFMARNPGAFLEEAKGAWEIRLAGRRFQAFQSLVLVLPTEEEAAVGTSQWICPSPLRPGCGRKNWFIAVRILPGVHGPEGAALADMPPLSADPRLVRFETFRSPGKGGQRVNKVETGARAIHRPTGLAAVSVTARSQAQNRRLALLRLEERLAAQERARAGQAAENVRRGHDLLTRGEAFAVFHGLDFKLQGL